MEIITGKVTDTHYKIYGPESQEVKDFRKIMRTSDSVNRIVVCSILDDHGWLSQNEVGQMGSSALFLVIQHATQATQEKYLPMLRDAVKKGNANGANLALLEDRIALSQGKKQIYGSQIGIFKDTREHFIRPLDDPDNVDKRRAEVGLPPMADYVSKWNMTWDAEQYKKDLPALEQKIKQDK